MDMGPSSVSRLHRLQKRTEAASYSETVRNALLLHEAVLDALKDGGTIVVRSQGSETTLIVPMEDMEKRSTDKEGGKNA